MAKTKKARLTKNDRLIREALTSQGRPLPGTSEHKAWLAGRALGEKESKLLPPSALKFSRQMALFLLNGVHEQLENILCVAIGGLKYQAQVPEQFRNGVTGALLA
jgi:hypothetical protein